MKVFRPKRAAELQELPHWVNSVFLDAEMKRRLTIQDKPKTEKEAANDKR